MIAMAILAVLILIAGFVAFLIWKDLMRLLILAESTLLSVEALLKARHDLVPDLLDAVRDYASD
jgi:hypothetical protein